MVYAMFIVFLLILDIHTAHCQTITTPPPNLTYNCSFSSNLYSSNSAVSNQFQFTNQTSLILTANYAFLPSPISIPAFQIGLIYPFDTSTHLVPFPVAFDCASTVRYCRLQTVAGTTSRYSEPIYVPLTSFNYTSTTTQFTQMGLYLNKGQYQLSNCTFDDGRYVTDPDTKFIIQIQYEKPVGTSCNPLIDTCGSSSLTTCSPSSSTCNCLSSSSLVSYSNSYYCADTLNISNCKIFPTRCITWCNSTTNNLCICPIDTLKIQRNDLYVCELPVNSLNCSSNDTIRRCPYGQNCIDGQCINNVIVITSTTTTIRSSEPDQSYSTDQRLRIALGVIAGLLGTSVLILLGTFCWLRYRQKKHRIQAEKPLSTSSSSTSSSLYISPIQQQDNPQRNYSSVNRIYQLPVENSNRIFAPIYRTDSFREAVRSGYARPNQVREHISSKRDSFIERPDDFMTPAYSTIEFVNPIHNQNNVYQVINPSSSSTILTHSV